MLPRKLPAPLRRLAFFGVATLAALPRLPAATASAASAAPPAREALVTFAPPWTSPHRVDPLRPHHFVNAEGEHLFILNKTAWAFFGQRDPAAFLERSRAQGVNVIRVALEGRPYHSVLGIDLWPWGGTRQAPRWDEFNPAYWDEVERRVRLAGEHGIGLNVTLYFSHKFTEDEIPVHRAYWAEALRRLGRYSNVFLWEVANETTRAEAFQDACGTFFRENDPWRRPVATSDGTTDDAVWPEKPWMDVAIVHTCTGSTPRHDLAHWYQAVARNTRAHGKPAFNNESGREVRHKNDDPIHRRKQGWLWNTEGAFWTHHSWDGCEGIDDPDYRAPGQEFLAPLAAHFRALPFWRLQPNFTACVFRDPALVGGALAAPDRSVVAAYVCTRESGREVNKASARLRLPDGRYRITFLRPADRSVIEVREHGSDGLGRDTELPLPAFTDDLAIVIENTVRLPRSLIEGTR